MDIIDVINNKLCRKKPKSDFSDEEITQNVIYLPLPKEVLAPLDNPSNLDKVTLEKLLFYDPILAGNRDVAYATCHHPNFGYVEFKDISIGVNGFGLSDGRVFKSPNEISFVKKMSILY